MGFSVECDDCHGFLWAGWGENMPVGRSGFFIFFLFSKFVKLEIVECTGGKVNKNKKIDEKKR